MSCHAYNLPKSNSRVNDEETILPHAETREKSRSSEQTLRYLRSAIHLA